MNESRKITNIYKGQFVPYDLDGQEQENITLLNISYDPKLRKGWYAMRLEPGAETVVHVHDVDEEFLILEGDLIEDDGTTLKPGDFVTYPKGTRHNSRTNTGCLLIGINHDGV
ncbi:MAG: cupin [Acidiferrobacteraceae bacterium]|nr:cupin [Acidiferrobacteraceae bacterium]|tara:strand:+ start:16061 stop:16399 length:339 start_codon:yes stop_codon:yes gene_type:complete